MSFTHLNLKQGIAWVERQAWVLNIFLGKASAQTIQSYSRERAALRISPQGGPLTIGQHLPNCGSTGGLKSASPVAATGTRFAIGLARHG